MVCGPRGLSLAWTRVARMCVYFNSAGENAGLGRIRGKKWRRLGAEAGRAWDVCGSRSGHGWRGKVTVFLGGMRTRMGWGRVKGRGRGARGWCFANWLWQMRGMVDRLLGGVGLRRGRRHPDDLRAGDALDFWRVEALAAGRMVRLRAEMKLPARARLQYEAQETQECKSRLEHTVVFIPKGLAGLTYWYALYPPHARIFRGLIRACARRAERLKARTVA